MSYNIKLDRRRTLPMISSDFVQHIKNIHLTILLTGSKRPEVILNGVSVKMSL